MDVKIFEEHSAVMAEWRKVTRASRTLVYFDAHLDLQHVNDRRLHRLDQADAESIRQLQKPHFLMPDENYSFSIYDFLCPAQRLKIIDQLIWVVPPHVHIGYSDLALRQIQQMEGVNHADLLSFKKNTGGWLTGRLLGLNITICDYSHLPAIDPPNDSLIDFDIDYFVTIPGDRIWINPKTVFETLAPLCRSELVTISRSVESGFTPIRYRFLADYLAALFEQRPTDVAHFDRLLRLDDAHFQGHASEALAGVEEELCRFPDCAATFYLHGLCAPDSIQAEKSFLMAAERNAAYAPSALRGVCELLGRKLPFDRVSLEVLEASVPEIHDSERDRALAYVALGMCYCHANQLDCAKRLYDQANEFFGCHPAFALRLGQLLLRSNQHTASLRFLQTALKDDETRCEATVLLAQVQAELGMLDQAATLLEAARKMAPAWLELLPMYAAIQHRRGQFNESRQLLETFDVRQKQLDALTEQLR